MKFNYEENFEPSRGLKKFSLYLPKSSNRFAGLILPGVFEVSDLWWRILCFIFIPVLEITAYKKSVDMGVGVDAVLALIFIDFVVAFAGHIPIRHIVELKNKNIYQDDARVKSNNVKITVLSLFLNLARLIIIVLAFVKFNFLYSLYPEITPLTMLVFVCYILGSVLHIACTGNVLYSLLFYTRFWYQHLRFTTSDRTKFIYDKDDPRRTEFVTGLDIVEKAVGHHEIKKVGDKTYQLQTKGILMDAELAELITDQVHNDKMILIAKIGVEHQIEKILNTETKDREEK